MYLIHDIRSKSYDVLGENLREFGFFVCFAQSDVVDKAAIAAAIVQQEELFIFVDDHSVLSGEDFAVKKSRVGFGLS